MPEVYRSLFSRLRTASARVLDDFLHNMSLARKLMLVYTVILALIVAVFAGQLIAGAAQATERAFIADTRRLVKDSRHEIERSIEICERSINAVSSDYELVEYVRTWDKNRTDIFSFRLELEKKIDQIQRLGPELHQFRIFTTRAAFPEISATLYQISRIPKARQLLENPELRTSGVWVLDHPEETYNLLISSDLRVVSLYKAFRYPVDTTVLVTEASMTREEFFRPVFAQPDQANFLPFVLGPDGELLFDQRNSFMRETGIGIQDVREAALRLPAVPGGGTAHVEPLGMNLVYEFIPRINVYFAYLISNETVMADLRHTRNLIIVEALAAFILLSFVISFITRLMLRKMSLIIASMRQVQDGKLDTRVAVNGQDEMGELAYHFNMMLHRIEDLICMVVKKQEASKNAEIRALFTQINSHFIINVLENIRMMAEVDGNYPVADSIVSLGKLMRYGLSWEKEYVRLQEEIAYIRSYIDLVNMRYNCSVTLDVQVPAPYLNRDVLKLSLQPVVENAVYHGLEPRGKGGVLHIEGYAEGHFFVIGIRDDGIGMEPDTLERVRKNMLSRLPLDVQEKRGHGIGLRNVHERIRLFYGQEYGLDIRSEAGQYTQVLIRLPYP